MTSEDVKYSYDRYAFGADSAAKIDWPWLEKTEAPDASTFVVTAKFPYADAIASMTQRYFCEILCKEHEESAEHEKKLLGTGPYTFVSYEPPLSTKYKRNPEYHRQPFPYFDEIERLGTSDEEKKIADFTSKQTHVTYWFAPESRDRIKKQRPDAHMWKYPAAGSNTLYMRTRQAAVQRQARAPGPEHGDQPQGAHRRRQRRRGRAGPVAVLDRRSSGSSARSRTWAPTPRTGTTTSPRRRSCSAPPASPCR